MSKYIFIIVVLILIGGGMGLLLGKSNQISDWLQGEQIESNGVARNFNNLQDRELVEISFDRLDSEEIVNDKQVFKVEVVNSPQSTTLGLSGREKIGNDGMLFIFPNKAFRSFWMKDMKFDLDIIWIADGQVVEISRDVPKPESDTSDFRLPTYSPEMDADMVLEVESGNADTFGISVGDRVILR